MFIRLCQLFVALSFTVLSPSAIRADDGSERLKSVRYYYSLALGNWSRDDANDRLFAYCQEHGGSMDTRALGYRYQNVCVYSVREVPLYSRDLDYQCDYDAYLGLPDTVRRRHRCSWYVDPAWGDQPDEPDNKHYICSFREDGKYGHTIDIGVARYHNSAFSASKVGEVNYSYHYKWGRRFEEQVSGHNRVIARYGITDENRLFIRVDNLRITIDRETDEGFVELPTSEDPIALNCKSF